MNGAVDSTSAQSFGGAHRARSAAALALWVAIFALLAVHAPRWVAALALTWAALGLAAPRLYLLTLAPALALFGNNPGGPHHLYLLDMGLMGFVARDLIERLAGRRSRRPCRMDFWIGLLIAISTVALAPQVRWFVCEAAVHGSRFIFRLYNHYANAPVFGLRLWLDLLLSASLYAALRDAPLDLKWRRALWISLLAGLTLASVAGLLDRFDAISLEFYRGVNPDLARFNFRRLQSLFRHSGWFAEYLAALAPAALAFGLAASGARRAALLALAAFFALTQLLTFQRAGWLSLAAGFAAVVAATAMTRRGPELRRLVIRSAAATLAGALAVGALAAVVPALGDRLVSIARIEDRARIWAAAWGMAREHPIEGVGLGNYAMTHEFQYGEGHPNATLDHMTAHNAYLHVFTERGVFGLFALIGLGWAMARALDRRARAPTDETGADRLTRPESIALFGGLVAFAVYAVFQYVFHVRAIEVLFWLMAGLTVGGAGLAPVGGRAAAIAKGGAAASIAIVLALLIPHLTTPWRIYSPSDNRNYLSGGEVVRVELPIGATRVRVPVFSFDPSLSPENPVVFTFELEGRRLGEAAFERPVAVDKVLDLPPNRNPLAPLVIRASRVWSPYRYGLYRIPVLISGVLYLPPEPVEPPR